MAWHFTPALKPVCLGTGAMPAAGAREAKPSRAPSPWDFGGGGEAIQE